MNIYFGIFFAILIACACAAAGFEGHKIGVEHQQAVDHAQFDRINADIAKQKTQAAAILADANAANLKLATDRDALKTNLGKAHAAAEIATNSLRVQLVGSSLRFAADKDSGCGPSSPSTASTGTNAASPAAPAIVRLPDETARRLFAIAFEADQLADAYRECYGWAQQVK